MIIIWLLYKQTKKANKGRRQKPRPRQSNAVEGTLSSIYTIDYFLDASLKLFEYSF